MSPNSGLAQRLLDNDPLAPGTAATGGSSSAPGAQAGAKPASSSHIRLRQGLLELLKAVFAGPGSPFLADKATSGEWGRGLLVGSQIALRA